MYGPVLFYRLYVWMFLVSRKRADILDEPELPG